MRAAPAGGQDVRAPMRDYSPPPAGNGYFFSAGPAVGFVSGGDTEDESSTDSFSTNCSEPRRVGANLRTTLVTGAVNLAAVLATRRQRAVELISSSSE